ncbi:TonB-dependent siderophore receptor [Thalassospira marina]|uniref:TonB-dependent siderophore receptor n=1 Tax=Thalassospira marina TaxID=2048283 RepID=A0A2N3KDA0_9PROT|nr:TonB-dependent siderophore receptor [Thalassospira marina]PKR48538.1 TonB-dependent siderophore receptor [Thalassospira marina]
MHLSGWKYSSILLGGTALALLGTAPDYARAQSTNSTETTTQAESTSDNPVVLDPIKITRDAEAQDATSPVRGYVAKRTATGSKSDTPIEEIPQSVSVIGREEMDHRGVDKLDEALRYTAGVFTQPYGSDTDTNWFYIRGFNATQSGVYLDGLQNYAYGFGAFLVEDYNLERVEVLRGAASVLYGGTNPGGMVNYVSKRPTAEPMHQLELSVTDTGKFGTGIDYSDRLSNTAAYRLTGQFTNGEEQADDNEGFQGSIAPSFLWTPNDDTSLTLLSSFTFVDGQHNGGLGFLPYTGTVVSAPYGKIHPETNFTEPDLDKDVRRQFMVGYELEHEINDDLTFRQNARIGHTDIHEVYYYPFGYAVGGSAPTTSNYNLTRYGFEHRTKITSIGLDNQLEQKFTTGSLDHTLLGGIDLKRFHMKRTEYSSSATAVDPLNPAHGQAQPAMSAYLDQDIDLNQIGFYTQDQIRFGDGWITTLNGRYDYVSTDADDPISTNNNYDDTEGEWSGRAGLAYNFDMGLTPYVSASTFFNPVLGSSAQGVFRPETGEQYEAGVKYVPQNFDALFTLAVFDLTRQNVITGTFGNERQLGEVNSRGIEFEAKANLTKELSLTASATAFDLEITKEENQSLIGKQPVTVPTEMANMGLDYTFRDGALDGLRLGGGVRYQGASYADDANQYKVPSATVFDAGIGYGVEDQWDLSLNVSNLFDKEYVAGCSSVNACGYAEGRTALLKLTMNW